MENVDKKMIIVINVDNGYLVSIHAGIPATPQEQFVAKNWPDVMSILAGLNLDAPKTQIDDILRRNFGMDVDSL